YPAIPAMHRASSLGTPEEVRVWRGVAPSWAQAPSGAQAITGDAESRPTRIPLQPLHDVPGEPIDAVIRRRGSTRAFERSAAIGFEQLSTILGTATRPLDADFLEPGAHV